MKNIYILGQQAKSIFEASWKGKTKQQSRYLIGCIYTFYYQHYFPSFLYLFLQVLLTFSLIEAQAKQKALRMISELARFYDVVLWSDEESESDATEVVLQDVNVDDYMEALLAEWGIDWQRVLKLGMQHMQAQSQHAGVKRAGDASSREEKKTRRSREEEAD
jgi:hypothetical protein